MRVHEHLGNAKKRLWGEIASTGKLEGRKNVLQARGRAQKRLQMITDTLSQPLASVKDLKSQLPCALFQDPPRGVQWTTPHYL